VRVEPGAYQRSRLETIAARGERAHGASPLWARWNDELGERYTLGVEEELMLLEPGDWSLVQSSDEVLARLSDELSAHTFPETHAAENDGLHWPRRDGLKWPHLASVVVGVDVA
jgi:hypothetical protein